MLDRIIILLENLLSHQIIESNTLVDELINDTQLIEPPTLDQALKNVLTIADSRPAFYKIIDRFYIEENDTTIVRGIPSHKFAKEVIMRYDPRLSKNERFCWSVIDKNEYMVLKHLLCDKLLAHGYTFIASKEVAGALYEEVLLVEEGLIKDPMIKAILPFLRYAGFDKMDTYYFTIDKDVSDLDFFKHIIGETITAKDKESLDWIRYFYENVFSHMAKQRPIQKMIFSHYYAETARHIQG